MGVSIVSDKHSFTAIHLLLYIAHSPLKCCQRHSEGLERRHRVSEVKGVAVISNLPKLNHYFLLCARQR
jgi:hypothetical protein